MKLVLIVLALPIVYAIIGGQPVPFEGGPQHITYEHIVSLQRNGEHFCAGVIFNLRRVLTAASCVYDKNAEEISVLTSDRLLNGSGERFGVSDIILKKPYGPRRVKNNIAFLVTDGNMYSVSDRQWGYVPMESVDNVMNVTIFGWGEVKVDSSEISNVLMYQSTNTITVEECKKYNPGVDSSNICVRSNENSGPCSYDEGGPITGSDFSVIGIATPDLSCGSDSPDVYTQLHAHLDWIIENDGSKLGVNIAIIGVELLILYLFSLTLIKH